jgi:hypothetical protein
MEPTKEPTMANHKTCKHNVIDIFLTEDLELDIICVSCGTDVTDVETRDGKRYKYDAKYRVWVHTPKE